MSEFTVLRDTREQEGYGYYFEDYPVDVTEVKLETGDYAAQEPGYYGKNGKYIPPFAVERKAKGDFVSSITADRDRFEREIERASNWESPMPIVIESPLLNFKNENYYADVHPNAIMGTIDKWPNYKNCEFFFKQNQVDAEKFTFELLRWWLNRD